ncbi:MAG: flavodoxin family protein [Deltaproteobacteria bacterium]|nr:flavodoxin family protein [Deltaproteobacteria bacterium]
MNITAVYGSPRRQGNTSRLLAAAVAGARSAGACVTEIVLRDLKLSPCLEIYGCRKDGRCAIKDDFQTLAESLVEADATILATPVFFYAVSAHTKIMMDRCQSLWVKKYWLEKKPLGRFDNPKPGLFITVGASRGERLFDGAKMSVKHFFDTFDTSLWRSLTYRGLDQADEILLHPEYLDEARRAGVELVELNR